MSLSVIVATYRQPDWLELCLHGLAAQRDRDFEVLVADDGSGPETAARIDAVRAGTGLDVRHVWHEDDGFRKCTILNRAILAARTDYCVFTDGDCIARADFIGVHRAQRERGRFLSGGYAKLSRTASEAIEAADVRAGRATDYVWLRRRGAPSNRALRRLALPRALAPLLDAVTPTRASFNGHNASAWKDDLVRVNGFNEDMGYGGLDRELGERLENAGVRGKQIRHRALVVHLDHPRGYRDEAVLRRNRAIRDELAASGRTRAERGLDRHADAPPQ
ncbi:MAG TPA: glycosyltransferase family 2 protein [Longimicrobiales bacterium]|nr:glycosyltransferase family 2 protein [Longimicrobiales bacterium]